MPLCFSKNKKDRTLIVYSKRHALNNKDRMLILCSLLIKPSNYKHLTFENCRENVMFFPFYLKSLPLKPFKNFHNK